MAAYQELKEQIQEKEAQQQTFQQLEETIRETEQQRVTLQQQLKETQQDLLQVAEQQRHFPLYEEWQSLPEETENVVLVKEDQVQLEETFQEYMYLDKERQRLTKELSLPVRSARCSRRLCFLPRTRIINSTIVESTL